jgi:hypothetical protein
MLKNIYLRSNVRERRVKLRSANDHVINATRKQRRLNILYADNFAYFCPHKLSSAWYKTLFPKNIGTLFECSFFIFIPFC